MVKTQHITAGQLAIGQTVIWRGNDGIADRSVVTALRDDEAWLSVGFDKTWGRRFNPSDDVEVAAVAPGEDTGYDDDNCCYECRAHIADPHDPGCSHLNELDDI